MAALAAILEEYTIQNATPANRAGRAVFIDSVQALMADPDEETEGDEEGELSAVDASMTMPMAGVGLRPLGVVGQNSQE